MFKNKKNTKLDKCIKISGKGKILHKRCGKNHMLCKKSNSRKRKLTGLRVISNSMRKQVKDSLNI